MRLFTIAIVALLAIPAAIALAPTAVAAQPPPQCIGVTACCLVACGPLLYYCVDGVKECWTGDACVGYGRGIPVCADVPCYSPVDCVATQSVECSQAIYVGGVSGRCNDVAFYLPCQYCAFRYSVYYCTEDTDLNVECHPGNVFDLVRTVVA